MCSGQATVAASAAQVTSQSGLVSNGQQPASLHDMFASVKPEVSWVQNLAVNCITNLFISFLIGFSSRCRFPCSCRSMPSFGRNHSMIQDWLSGRVTPGDANHQEQPLYDLSAYASFPVVAIPGARNNRISTASTSSVKDIKGTPAIVPELFYDGHFRQIINNMTRGFLRKSSPLKGARNAASTLSWSLTLSKAISRPEAAAPC